MPELNFPKYTHPHHILALKRLRKGSLHRKMIFLCAVNSSYTHPFDCEQGPSTSLENKCLLNGINKHFAKLSALATVCSMISVT